ncbi:hypothetical protein CKO51_13095 [Rhodopirellula sp. SM50]|nr:hypothetical protein [Rhodopirellula sp. SM50]PAY19064.1 hypothetical protein CKO51_13095 [Rhodopirellula sp. SM50]
MFWLPEEQSFLDAIEKNHRDEAAFDRYADWLEERTDPRAHMLRFFAQIYFAQDPSYRKLDRDGEMDLIGRLEQVTKETSQPWLQRLFGRGGEYEAIRGRLRSCNLIGAGASWRMLG